MTEDNNAFEPVVWIESVVAALASFIADPRLRYAYGVQPNVVEGEISLVVAPWLESEDRATYDYVLEFARTYQLQIVEDRRTGDRALPRPA